MAQEGEASLSTEGSVQIVKVLGWPSGMHSRLIWGGLRVRALDWPSVILPPLVPKS